MVIAGLLVMALLLTAAAWVMRPAAASANGQSRLNGHSRVVELLDHVRDTGRRFAHRNGNKPVAAPPVESYNQRLDGFDLRSVAQFSVKFFGSLAAAACVGFVVIWVFASIVGAVGDLERFMRDIGFADFRFLSIQVIFGVVVLASAAVAFCVTFTVVAAALYNVLARRHGGIRIATSSTKASVQATAAGTRLAPPPRKPARRAS